MKKQYILILYWCTHMHAGEESHTPPKTLFHPQASLAAADETPSPEPTQKEIYNIEDMLASDPPQDTPHKIPSPRTKAPAPALVTNNRVHLCEKIINFFLCKKSP